jgi:hypothetical protein
MLIYNLNSGDDYLFSFKIVYNTYIQSAPLSLHVSAMPVRGKFLICRLILRA